MLLGCVNDTYLRLESFNTSSLTKYMKSYFWLVYSQTFYTNQQAFNKTFFYDIWFAVASVFLFLFRVLIFEL